jgi:hypothetical protein
MAGNGALPPAADPDDFLHRGKLPEERKGSGCEETYKRGYAYDPFDPRTYDIYHPCKIDMKNGVPANTVAVLPPIGEHIFKQFLDKIPLLSADDIRGAPDGIYTWIVFSRGGVEKQFVACPVRDAFEIGTKHGAIAFRVGATHIHNGGEIMKSGGTMRFNLQSGTYMKYWLKDRAKKAEGYCNHLELHAYLQEKFKEMFPDAVFQDDPFKMGNPTAADLKMYRFAGFRIVDVSGLSYDACTAKIDGVLSQKGGRKTRRRRRRYTRRR